MTEIAASNAFDDIAARIREEHEAMRTIARSTLAHAIKLGELLIEAKKLVKHGDWIGWLEQHCQLTKVSAVEKVSAPMRQSVGNARAARGSFADRVNAGDAPGSVAGWGIARGILP